jgi:hypothetical protein
MRLVTTVAATVLITSLLPSAMAQAPVNDVVSWPPGLILLAAVLFAALGAAPDTLWNLEPAIGLFMGEGLSFFAVPTMQRVAWVAKACHFVPHIRSTNGISNFWIRSDQVSAVARAEALKAALDVMSPVAYEPVEGGYQFDVGRWKVTNAGLLQGINDGPPRPPNTTEIPTARDFLYFAAIHYHAFWEWDVQIMTHDKLLFTTCDSAGGGIFDVDSPASALPIVAAQMVRRPYSQSVLRGRARHEGTHEYGPYVLDIQHTDRDEPICAIDFHSYAPDSVKVIASLNDLAGAYYRVVQYLKRSSDGSPVTPGTAAHVLVGETMWLAIFGGELLDHGRLTFQNLPGRMTNNDSSADEAYLMRVITVLNEVKPYTRSRRFADLVESGGNSRRQALPFFVTGLVGQFLICYFIAVGTTAGIWTSVAFANSLFSGKLSDLHSIYWGKTETTEESGMKMYRPITKELMVVGTFDRTTPRQGDLRPGLLLNSLGLIAAILGSIFQTTTRKALGFSSFRPTPPWVVYTSIVLTVSVSLLIALTIMLQQVRERTWNNNSELPTRWLIYSTIPFSIVIGGLALLFKLVPQWTKLWPVLDALTWLSGFPLGTIENGRMISADHSTVHMVLVNRWLMGAVASAVGSSRTH